MGGEPLVSSGMKGIRSKGGCFSSELYIHTAIETPQHKTQQREECAAGIGNVLVHLIQGEKNEATNI